MEQQTKEESKNVVNHHDDDGIINDNAEENGLEDDGDFDVFHDNEDVTRKAIWRTMNILMGFTRMRMLTERMTRPIWMR